MTSGPLDDRGLSATAPAASGDAAAVPASVGRFVVLSTVGAGSMGVVVAAYDPVLDRRIALKVLRASPNTASEARLIQEAQAMARLAHPSVVAVHEAGVADGLVYLAMEFVAGGTLRAWLAAAPRGWREIRDRFVEAGRGLAAAHDAGLVHRDFKPDNVLIGRDGHARVTDFGLVRSVPAVPDDAGADTTSVAGTPRYMAPEQHRGERADARADQFAFCVALYEALWQADPFAASDPAARRARILGGELTPPPLGRVPARLAAAVVRGLAVDPERRYPSMRALLDDLVRDPAIDRRRRLRLIAVGLAGAALATVINGALGRGGDGDGGSYAGAPDPQRFQLGIAVASAPDALDTAALDQIARAGATATHLEFDWSRIAPAPGVLDWTAADQQVVEVEQRGLEPFVTTGRAPAWLGRDRNAQCSEPFRNPPPGTEAGGAAFREFFRALSSRYCGRVKYYEFWSEPNGCAWMSCGCGDQTARQRELYAHWLDDWYQAMREGCGDVVLAVGGLDCSWGSDPERPSTSCAAFVDELYRNSAADAFDAVALHPSGYTADPGAALRGHKALNWEAIRQVSAVLERHGSANRMLWITDWGVPAADPQLQAELVGAALTGLRGLSNVFTAQYAAITDRPAAGERPAGARSPSGLVSIAGPPGELRLAPRPAWFAFRDRALGADTVWHGPVNPGMEFQGQPPSNQFSWPIPFWGPSGAWQYHRLFPRDGNGVLGRKAGFYAAGEKARLGQTLADPFVPGRRYCFRSAAQGGRDNLGVVPYQIGYLDAAGSFVALHTRIVAVDARWRQTEGVCHDVAAAAPEVGRPISVGFGSGGDGGSSDIWVDNMQVTSSALVPAR